MKLREEKSDTRENTPELIALLTATVCSCDWD